MSLALELLTSTITKLFLNQARIFSLIDFRALSLFTGLHYASYLGIFEVATALIR